MKQRLLRLLYLMDSERVYAALLITIGFSCLAFSLFLSVVLDAVCVLCGVFLLLSATVRLVLLVKDKKEELFYFANFIKEACLIFSGITLISLRSGFANALCLVIGAYIIMRSLALIFFIGYKTGRERLSAMEKAEICISIGLCIVGVLMITLPPLADILVGIVLLGKGLELIIKNPPTKPNGKTDDYITTDFVDKSEE